MKRLGVESPPPPPWFSGVRHGFQHSARIRNLSNPQVAACRAAEKRGSLCQACSAPHVANIDPQNVYVWSPCCVNANNLFLEQR